ncbi:MAG: branched-chain amino acid ABC transporter substrate-binding protein, partial [Tardiphaga sp.]|nr:branched-chain amino acid ABC transporter substrate-binding protein [Tardiphaga sp.]
NGEWDKARVLMVQYQGITDNTIDQFRKETTQVVLYPPEFKSGTLRAPFLEAK